MVRIEESERWRSQKEIKSEKEHDGQKDKKSEKEISL